MIYLAPTPILIPHRVRRGQLFECRPANGNWHHAWNITLANLLMYAAARCNKSERFASLQIDAALRQTIERCGTETDPLYVRSDACDPRVPAITVRINGIDWIIDGWQRARRAVLMQWPALPVFRLGEKDDHLCRICRCCRADGIDPTAIVGGEQ